MSTRQRHYNSRLPLLSETWKSFPHWTLDEENQSVATSSSGQLDPPPYRPIALEVLEDVRPIHELIPQFLSTSGGRRWETNLAPAVLRFLTSRCIVLAGVPKAHRLVVRQLAFNALDAPLYGRYPLTTTKTAVLNLAKVESGVSRRKTFARSLNFIRKQRLQAGISPTLNFLAAIMYALPTQNARYRREALYCAIDLLLWLCAETDAVDPARAVARDVRATRRAHRALIRADKDTQEGFAAVPGWRIVSAKSFSRMSSDSSVLIDDLAEKPFAASKIIYNGTRCESPITPLEMALLAYDFGEQVFHPPLVNETAAVVSVMEAKEGVYARAEFARIVFSRYLRVQTKDQYDDYGVVRASRHTSKQLADIRREQAAVLRRFVPAGSALLWMSLITDESWGLLQYGSSETFDTGEGDAFEPYLIDLLARHCTFEQTAELINTVMHEPNALALVAAKLVSGIDTDLATEMFG